MGLHGFWTAGPLIKNGRVTDFNRLMDYTDFEQPDHGLEWIMGLHGFFGGSRIRMDYGITRIVFNEEAPDDTITNELRKSL